MDQPDVLDDVMLGVVIVTYHSADVIGPCLDSLSEAPGLRIAVVDNASADATVEAVRAHARQTKQRLAEDPAPGTPARLVLVRSPVNRGFAGGVNLGLAHLAADPKIKAFWLLNPDCVVPPGTPETYARAVAAAGPFALMGGRTLSLDPPGRVQTDGGRVGRFSGICRSVGRGRPADVPLPKAASLDFLSGSNLVASRAFLDHAGPMREDYFLFYEEVDWAFRRGDLPLVVVPGAVVLHHGGTATGSGNLRRSADAFANYFNFRNRMRFLARFRPWALPTAWGLGLAKAAQILFRDGTEPAAAAVRGMHGLAPPAPVRARIAPDARPLAFGRR